MPAKPILWPTDFFESDHEALAVAANLCAAWRTDLLALHVIGDVAEEVYEEKSTEGKDQAAWALWRLGKEKAERRLAEIIEKTVRGGQHCEVLTAFGDPTRRILDTIRERDVGLVVLGARREKSLLREMLLGSVAYTLVRTAPCSVLLVK